MVRLILLGIEIGSLIICIIIITIVVILAETGNAVARTAAAMNRRLDQESRCDAVFISGSQR